MIPGELNCESFRTSLSAALGFDRSAVVVHSLSETAYVTWSESGTLVATVTFGRRPLFYQGRGKLLNTKTSKVDKDCEYCMSYFNEDGAKRDALLFIDQHFIGFTPLTPVDKQRKCYIE